MIAQVAVSTAPAPSARPRPKRPAKVLLCIVPMCRKPAGVGTGGRCYCCRSREYRAAHVLQAAYYDLKSNAKRRGKSFSLTLEDFKEFAVRTEYAAKRGRRKDSYTIDRIRDEEGYHRDNIRVLTNTQNVQKENARRAAAARTRTVQSAWNPETREMEFWSTYIGAPPPITDAPEAAPVVVADQPFDSRNPFAFALPPEEPPF